MENNYLFPSEAKEKSVLEHKVRNGTVTDEDEKNLSKIDKKDKERNKAIVNACEFVSSAACQKLVEDANYAKYGYEQNLSYNIKIKELYPNDYDNVLNILKGKDKDSVEFEKIALSIAKSENISLDKAKERLGYIKAYQNFADLVGMARGSSALKLKNSLGKPADFSVEAPKAISGKDRQVTVGETENYGKSKNNLRVSSGAENVALYPKLKEQLIQENLQNIVHKNPVLEHVAHKNGNLTIPEIFTKEEINKLALDWVGENPIRNSDGGLLSADGTRRYRPPKEKIHSIYAETRIQANFERGYINSKGKFVTDSNLHLNVGDKK